MINWNKVIVASDDDTVQVVCGKSIFFAVSRVAGIDRVVKTSTSGLVDRYTMYRTDDTVAGTFTVTNGRVTEIHICSSSEYDSQTLIPTIANPQANTFYLVPSGTGNDMYDEWIYVNNAWEKFGSASIDLSNYVTKSELEEEVYFENEYESVNGLLDLKDTSTSQVIKEAVYTYPPSLTGIHWLEAMILNKNLIYINNLSVYPATQNGVTFTVNDDGSISYSGTPTAEIDISPNLVTLDLPVGQYTFSGGVSEDCYIYIYGSTLKSTGGDLPVQINANTSIIFNIHINNTGTFVSGTFYPMFRLRSSTDDTYIKPLYNSMWADFGSSLLYGGYYDFVNAIRCITHKHIDSYNGESLPGAWISDRDTYVEGTLPSTGASVTYELAEPEIEETTKTKWNKTLLDGETVILLNQLNSKINISLDKISVKDTVLELKNSKQDTLTFDTTPTANSTNPVTSGGIKTALDSKANTSDLGTMAFEDDAPSDSVEYVRKNGTWAVSSGSGGGSGGQTVWGAIVGTLSQQTDLQNALNAKADQSSTYTKNEVNNLLSSKQDELTFDSTPTANSTNPVTSSGIKTALDVKANTADLGDLATLNSVDFDTQVIGKPSAYPPAAHNHDDRYYTETEVDTFVDDLQDQIDNINNFAIHICSTTEYDETTHIPTVTNPNETTFYLVPNGIGNDVYDEYIYTNNAWEKFGSARIDLTQYYTKTQTDELLNTKANESIIADEWNITKAYSKDDIVIYNHELYKFTENVNSKLEQIPVVEINTTYHKDELFTYSNAVYKVLLNGTSYSGSDADLPNVIQFWLATEEIEIVNVKEYISGETYQVGDIVKVGNEYYIVTVAGSPTEWNPSAVSKINIADNLYTKSEIDDLLSSKQDTLTFDNTPTANSDNPVTSDGVKTALDVKADKSTTYTKTETDTLLANKADTTSVYTKTETDNLLNSKQNSLTFDNAPTANSDNPVKSGGIKTMLDAKADTSSVYTKNEADVLLANKANTADLGDLATQNSVDFDTQVTGKPSAYPPTAHNHDDRYYTETEVDTLLNAKQNSLIFDTTPTANSTNPVTSTGINTALALKADISTVNTALDGKADKSTTYTKTETDGLLDNKQDVLTFDSAPTADSANPVTSGGVYTAIANAGIGASEWGQITGTLSQQTDLQTALNNKQDILTFDSTPTANSSNPVTSDGVKSALNEKADISSLGSLASKDTISFTDIVLPQNELQTFFVSPNGSNNNDGSQDYPFYTIQRAVDTASPLALCRIYLYPGTYTHAFNVRNRTIIFYVLVDKDKQILIDPDVIIHGSGSSTFNSKRWSVYIGSNANVTIANGIWKIDGYTSSSTITIDGVVCVDNGTLLTKSAVSTFGTNDQPTLINSEVRIFDENDQSMINVINGGKLISNSKLTLNTNHNSEGIYVESGGNAFINQIAVEGNFDSTNNFMKSDCGIITYGSTNYSSFITKSNGGQIFTGN